MYAFEDIVLALITRTNMGVNLLSVVYTGMLSFDRPPRDKAVLAT